MFVCLFVFSTIGLVCYTIGRLWPDIGDDRKRKKRKKKKREKKTKAKEITILRNDALVLVYLLPLFVRHFVGYTAWVASLKQACQSVVNA